MRSLLHTGVAALAICPLWASPAFAQDVPAKPATKAEAGQSEPSLLDDIVVTAQKREQNIQDVGIAISAFSGELGRSLGWRDSEAIASQTPGLVATSFSGGSSTGLFSIRGISQNDFADHQEAPSAVYVDGVYQATTSQTTSELFDVDRVEVLRGPQGTLFGRNATGGLVHIITKRPTDRFEGYANLTYARFDQVRAEGAVSGAIANGVRGRLSFLTDNANGYFRNTNVGTPAVRSYVFGGYPGRSDLPSDDLRGRNHQNFRAQLEFDLGSTTVLGLAVHYGRVNRVGNGYDHVPAPNGVEDFSATDFYGSPFDPRPNAEAPNVGGFVDKRSITYQANLNAKLGDIDLVTILSYSNSKKTYLEDVDASIYNISSFGTAQNTDIFTAEARLSGTHGAFNWTAGYYYLNIDGNYFSTFQFPAVTGASGAGVFDGFGYGIDLDYSLKTEAHALFGQVEFSVTDQLKLIGGLRWTNDRKNFNILAQCVNDPDPSVAPNTTCQDFILGGGFIIDDGRTALRRENSFLTWKAQLEYKPNEDLLFYAGYNRGVKAGSFSAPLDGFLTANQLSFRPEKLDAYEVGVKADIIRGLARFNASAFYYDYKDYQAFVFVGIASIVRNYASTIYGGEAELNLSPGQGLEIRGGLSLLNARVKNVEVGPNIFADQRTILAPDVAANWLIRKEFKLGSTRSLSFQYDGNYTGRQQYNTLNSALASGPGYTLMNARATYSFELGSAADAELAVFVRNLLDTANQTYGFDTSAFFGNAIRVYGPPRIVGASLNIKF